VDFNQTSREKNEMTTDIRTEIDRIGRVIQEITNLGMLYWDAPTVRELDQAVLHLGQARMNLESLPAPSATLEASAPETVGTSPVSLQTVSCAPGGEGLPPGVSSPAAGRSNYWDVTQVRARVARKQRVPGDAAMQDMNGWR
jgi:hypothetical protein